MRTHLFLLLFAATACGPAEPSAESESELAGATPTEIKVQVDATQAIAKLGLSESGAEVRAITFYDTAGLELFDDGVILRTRRIAGSSDDDSTVKLRPMTAKSVDPSFTDESGFKCEMDKNAGKAATSSCSLTKNEPEKDILRAELGASGAKTVLSSTQEDFLFAHGKSVPWSRVVPLGPIDARVWKIDPKNWKAELTVERWDVPGGSVSVEVSLKTRWSDRTAEEKRLVDWLAARGLKPLAQQETKTRAALLALAKP